ncbi:MAG TPA: serine/threonine-protein kinase [Polyangia bacterium]|nr:serine/threonine-protein kinase [Polyangia bacterium]
MTESTLTRRCAACGYRFEATALVCPVDRHALPLAEAHAAELGAFVLVARIGDGGMGAVYRAVHKRLGRVVAIKLLHKDLTSDRALVGRFFYEARAANTIRHPHVVEVYDFVEGVDDVYFVMEYLEGEDLHEVIHRRAAKPMDPVRAVDILEQIAAALHATHTRRIVHRDLKPENVFLTTKDGRRDYVKVFDFGVAKLDRPDGRATVEGAVLGTPEYMAPEQASGGAIDGRADIYSLGCIAYEMLTRKQVFGGGLQSDILMRQLTFTPPPVRELVPEVPAGLEAVVMRALAKDPAKRPQTARAFAEQLTRAIGRDLFDPAAFAVGSRPTPLGTSVLEPPARALSLTRSPSRVRRFAVGAVVVAALAVGGAFFVRRPGPAPASVVVAAAPVASPVVVKPPSFVTIVLQSLPTGAAVVDDRGARLGVTPYELVLPMGGARRLRFEMKGFQPSSRDVVATADTTVAVQLAPEPAAPRPRMRAGGPRLADEATIDPFGGNR